MNLDKLKGLPTQALLSRQRELESKRRLTTVEAETLEHIRAILAEKKLAKTGASAAVEPPKQNEKQRESEQLKEIWGKPVNDLREKITATYPEVLHPPLEQAKQRETNQLAGKHALKWLAESNDRIAWAKDANEAIYSTRKSTIYIAPRKTSGDGVQLHEYTDAASNQKVAYITALNVPMTPACAAISLAALVIEGALQNGGLRIELEKPTLHPIERERLRMGVYIEAAEILSGGKSLAVAEQIVKELSLQSLDDISTIAANKEQWQKVVSRIMRTITRHPSRSLADESVRFHIAMHALGSFLKGNEMRKFEAKTNFVETSVILPGDARWGEVENIFTELGVQDIARFSFLHNRRGNIFLAPADAVPAASPLHPFVTQDNEETLDIAVALGKETDETASTTQQQWVSGKLPSVEELKTASFEQHKREWNEAFHARIASHSDLASQTGLPSNITQYQQNTQWFPFGSLSTNGLQVLQALNQSCVILSSTPKEFDSVLSTYNQMWNLPVAEHTITACSMLRLGTNPPQQVDIAHLKRVLVTDEWKAILYGGLIAEYAFRNGMLTMNRKSGEPMDLEEEWDCASLSNSARLTMIDLPYGDSFRDAAKAMARQMQILNPPLVYKMVREHPEQWGQIERRLDHFTTHRPPQSVQEAFERVSTYFETILFDSPEFNRPLKDVFSKNDRKIIVGLEIELAQRRMDRIPVPLAADDETVREQLALMGIDRLPDDCIVAREGARIIFLMPAQAYRESPLSRSAFSMNVTDDPLWILERIAALRPEIPLTEETANEWVSGTIPSPESVKLWNIKEELEQELQRIEIRKMNANLTKGEETGLLFMMQRIRNFKWMSAAPKINQVDQTPQDIVIPAAEHSVAVLCKSLHSMIYPERILEMNTADSTPAWRIIDTTGILASPENIEDLILFAFEKIYPMERNVAELNLENFWDNPKTFIQAVHRASHSITREWPRSAIEAYTRIQWLVTAQSTPQIPIKYDKDLDERQTELAKIYYEMRPQRITPQTDAPLQDLLTTLDEDLLTDSTITFAKANDRSCFVCPADKVPESLAEYRDADRENTLDLLVNLGLEKEDNLDVATCTWVSGTLPTMEELERKYFEAEIIPDRFLPNIKQEGDEDEGPDDEGPVPGPEGVVCGPPENPTLPRFRAIRDTLIRLKIPARVAFDGRTHVPMDPQFREVEPGHFVVITIPSANLQLLVSNDRTKGIRVIYNQFEPTRYATFNTVQQLEEEIWTTRLKFDDRQSFMKKFAPTLMQRMKDPYPIYPINSRHPNPFNTFENNEKQEALSEKAKTALLRDFQAAAKYLGKESIAELTASDFNSIPATAGLVWSFGGAAAGGTYLDRLAEEFGMNARVVNKILLEEDEEMAKVVEGEVTADEEEAKVRQDEFRNRIVQTLLWELDIDYQRAQWLVIEEAKKFSYDSDLSRSEKTNTSLRKKFLKKIRSQKSIEEEKLESVS